MKQSFQNTRYRAILLLTGLMLAMTAMAQTLTNDALDLSGMWRFQLDPMGFGKTPGSELYLDKLSETIMLPGSTDQGGKGIKNTNLFILEAKTSSIISIFLKNIPNTIIAKTGTVAFKLKIKFSIISSLKKKPHKRLNLHMRLSYIYFFLHL